MVGTCKCVLYVPEHPLPPSKVCGLVSLDDMSSYVYNGENGADGSRVP